MKTKYLFIAFLFLSDLISASGVKQPVHSQSGFIENKGQIIDQNNKPNPVCLFLYNGGGLHVQLKQNSFSYEVWKKTERIAESASDASTSFSMTNDTSYIHRIDVSFLNANKNPTIIASDVASDYINYYTTGTPETGVTHVRHFKKVLYQNIYPNIDVEFILNDQEQNGSPIANGFKYNFIIHPGGNPKDIRIKFDGATNASLNAEGNILIETAYGNIEESIPESYQMDDNNLKQKVTASFYTFHSSLFTFGISPGNYDASKTLIIDPWATYYGGSGDDRSFGIAVDGSGNIVIIGITGSTSGIATSGAHQTSYGGSTDAFMAKLNASGVRQWATYYGGSGIDYGNGIAVDGSGDIVITGYTLSTSGFATSGAYQTSIGGNADAYIAKFNASGVRQWATYFGGSGGDGGNGIAVDGSGNIVITGNTTSTTGIATTGAYQVNLVAYSDAFIANFSASGALQWATYYGDGGTEYGYGIAVDGSGNIIITGSTASSSGIATSGSHQSSFGGGVTDAFIAKFDASGVLQWATYYGGSGNDNSYGIAVDGSGNIVITGITASTSGITTSGAYQTSYGGNYDAFIAKFNASGVRQWATYYGGSGDDRDLGIDVDGSGYIIITGRTTSASGIATSGAYKTSISGTWDAFIAKFNTSGARQWATYYGGSGNDEGYGIAVDGSGNFVVTGQTASTTGIATSGAYQTSFGGGTWDAFVASFTAGGGLPVKLISFDAKLLSSKEVLLSWQTASETNNDFFEVERRGNPELSGTPGTTGTSEDNWEIVGTVKGAGNSNALKNYQFIDSPFLISHFSSHSPTHPFSPSSILYYRLKQVDYDGSYTYSNIVTVKLDEAMQNEPIIFPNPGNGNFSISTNQFIHELELFDPNGQSLLKMFDVTGTQQIHLGNDVKDGIYFLRIITDNGNMVKKIEVLR